MEKKEEKNNRFTYSSGEGLKIVSTEAKEDKKEEPKNIKKGFETWL